MDSYCHLVPLKFQNSHSGLELNFSTNFFQVKMHYFVATGFYIRTILLSHLNLEGLGESGHVSRKTCLLPSIKAGRVTPPQDCAKQQQKSLAA